MSWNVGDFMFTIIRTVVNFSSKLYDILNMQISLTWLDSTLKIFGMQTNIGSISLLGILGTLSASTLLVLIIYNLFRG